MENDDQIKRDVESPLEADDHSEDLPPDDLEEDDDLDDNFGRSLRDDDISTHPSMDTDVDATELYNEGLDKIADVDENEEKAPFEEDDLDEAA